MIEDRKDTDEMGVIRGGGEGRVEGGGKKTRMRQ